MSFRDLRTRAIRDNDRMQHALADESFDVRLEWGLPGARELSTSCSTLVLVDVLSFSTSVEVAVSRGATVYPCATVAEAPAVSTGAIVASSWRTPDGYSLSPASLVDIPAGVRLILPSPNGSAIAAALEGIRVLVGCLRNARAVARAADMEPPVGVVAAGERWPGGEPRWALEDYLGAGAIVGALSSHRSLAPEAQTASFAVQAADRDLPALIRSTRSGRELIAAGYEGDVTLALERDVSEAVPMLFDGGFRQLHA
jgi:2-phosphosulfolactate phosphatase